MEDNPDASNMDTLANDDTAKMEKNNKKRQNRVDGEDK